MNINHIENIKIIPKNLAESKKSINFVSQNKTGYHVRVVR